ncbi:MAG: adenylate/guanylate cyclase domain-containing protein [Polaromonas sp.]|nr:adenylate/guanylate cyclase domain-containing protein [Polaromonas sp.]MDP3607429.1 adenylate/guanylate cyclase domain-containing protein [Polaromonas sp.]
MEATAGGTGTMAPAQAGSATVARSRILVIEDNEDIRYLLDALLRESYEVMLAASGDAGLALAVSAQRPDIILLDVMMPDMDGYEVLQRLGRDTRTADIPVIFLTALGSVEEEHRGLDLGATDYVTKPISPPVLLARLKLHLERTAYARRLRDLAQQLSRYLAPQVYQSLFEGSRQAEIRTQRKKLTVFFSDIKNFTASTAKWQPEEVTLLLNSYFSEMSAIAADYGATLDKFIGDAIVIFFGDPQTLGVREDALQCVRMAIAMQKRMEALRLRWRGMGINKTFEIRIGINSGFCDVGNFGSELRMEYTIIGREVNLAARLEQAAEPGEILISSETHALVQGEIGADARDPVMAKGFAEPIPVYAVHTGAAESRSGSAIHCDRPGLRVDIDLGRVSAADRAETAASLRQMLEALESAEPQPGGAPLPPAPAADQVAPGATAGDGADPAWPLALDGLDLVLGLRRAMGMKPLYLSLLGRYRDGRRDTPARIRQALDAADMKTAELLSHSLRGVSAQIGATRVPADAQALEQAIHEGLPRASLDALLAGLESSLGDLVAALDAGLPPESARP